MATGSFGVRGVADEGVGLCRAGDWDRGVQLLGQLVEQRGLSDDLPGTAYSFLGFGIARFQKKVRDGLKLCEHAVRIQFYEPDNHLNSARVHLLARNRKAAVEAIGRGLKLDPHHAGLRALRQEIGIRKKPVLPFLSRNNPLNRLFGRIRHDFHGD